LPLATVIIILSPPGQVYTNINVKKTNFLGKTVQGERAGEPVERLLVGEWLLPLPLEGAVANLTALALGLLQHLWPDIQPQDAALVGGIAALSVHDSYFGSGTVGRIIN